ncbi:MULTISPECIES: hypothetical protein [unclassified Desulfovibrio]|uniref:hypothetical protein n=1 Tax=unclassified Desulfovibrio TaxID=2593640 RepID=UPI002FDA1A47
MARKKATALPQPEPEMFTIYGDITQETEDAILLTCNDDEVWLPKSQIEYAGERGDIDIEVTLPDWLAEDKGLVDGQGHITVFGDGEEQPQEATPEHNATMVITLTIHAFSENGETATVEDRYGNTADIPTDSFTHGEDGINVGDTVLCDVLASAVEPTDLCPDEPMADSEAPALLRKHDVHWLKRDTCTKAFPLSDEDKIALGKEMAAAQARIDMLEDELADTRKEYKAKIDAEQKRLSKAAAEFRRGKTEPQDVLCDVYQDFDSGELVYVTADDAAEEIMRRPMTTDERRPTLFDGPPDSGKGHSAPLGEDLRKKGTTEQTPQTWGHTCVNCAHIDNAEDGSQADECANCVQTVDGGLDNWAPRRECPTCNYKSMSVNMPPCSTCILNPEAADGASDDNWITDGVNTEKAPVEDVPADQPPVALEPQTTEAAIQ